MPLPVISGPSVRPVQGPAVAGERVEEDFELVHSLLPCCGHHPASSHETFRAHG
jgi:hypothetical protein